ncbi:BTAD domain-containing putative transcriptional regulator [Micromonospora sp. DH15]|nr:BTAD domain-containing putative transcriptional regulator [Micromonospora sp. DH15]
MASSPAWPAPPRAVRAGRTSPARRYSPALTVRFLSACATTMAAVQFGVLGPLAVTTDAGEPVLVPGAKVRVLLAVLLTNRNQVVSADRLIDDVWGSHAPANPGGALQVRVSQLRRALDDAEPGARGLVESRPPGYVLRTRAVDADRFAELATSTDVERLAAALALWRGDAYADVADAGFVHAEATRLAEQRLAVHERLAAAGRARGEHDLVAADLAELVTRHPLREGLRALQLRALYAAGRQSEALDSYADLRDRLATELGLDPGPELVALHRRILAQDSGLSAPPRAAIVRHSLPARLDELVGRAGVLAELRAVLPGRRLVTLVGPGGVGKTRLATEVAREPAGPDGGCLVELAPLPAGDPRVADRVLDALGLREPPGAAVPAADRLCAALTTATSPRPGARRRPGCAPSAPPRGSADSASTSGPHPPSLSSVVGWTACRWPSNWPRPGCARSACGASWTASTTGSGCSPRSSATCRHGSARWRR